MQLQVLFKKKFPLSYFFRPLKQEANVFLGLTELLYNLINIFHLELKMLLIFLPVIFCHRHIFALL